MSFEANLEINNDTAIITLEGELDASVAPQLKDKVEQAAGTSVKHLFLKMEKLEYMASAGLRVLVFAKQKMGSDVELKLVGTQEMVRDTIEKAGFQYSVTFVKEYEAVAKA